MLPDRTVSVITLTLQSAAGWPRTAVRSAHRRGSRNDGGHCLHRARCEVLIEAAEAGVFDATAIRLKGAVVQSNGGPWHMNSRHPGSTYDKEWTDVLQQLWRQDR
jgi:hypothetical protein